MSRLYSYFIILRVISTLVSLSFRDPAVFPVSPSSGRSCRNSQQDNTELLSYRDRERPRDSRDDDICISGRPGRQLVCLQQRVSGIRRTAVQPYSRDVQQCRHLAAASCTRCCRVSVSLSAIISRIGRL